MREVFIWTDGACSGNPGKGGWGAVLSFRGARKEISGASPNTTNNRMELIAVIEALRALKEPCKVVLTSDSKYVTDGINQGWAEEGKRRGWRKANKKPFSNADLWECLLSLLSIHDVSFKWVKGHACDPNNERCDSLAVEAYKKFNYLCDDFSFERSFR